MFLFFNEPAPTEISTLSPPRRSSDLGGRPPEWVKLAAHPAPEPWGPHPHSGGRRPEWVKVPARHAAQSWGPYDHSNRSEEHTSELSHANISYAVFCL